MWPLGPQRLAFGFGFEPFVVPWPFGWPPPGGFCFLRSFLISVFGVSSPCFRPLGGFSVSSVFSLSFSVFLLIKSAFPLKKIEFVQLAVLRSGYLPEISNVQMRFCGLLAVMFTASCTSQMISSPVQPFDVVIIGGLAASRNWIASFADRWPCQ